MQSFKLHTFALHFIIRSIQFSLHIRMYILYKAMAVLLSNHQFLVLLHQFSFRLSSTDVTRATFYILDKQIVD